MDGEARFFNMGRDIDLHQGEMLLVPEYEKPFLPPCQMQCCPVSFKEQANKGNLTGRVS